MSALSLPAVAAIFLTAAAVVAIFGVRLAWIADRIADRTGLGEALVGGLLLGMATSISGTVVSITAALDARPSLAFSNAIGGIAAQTAFLALADILYRKANLEHASADLVTVLQSSLLVLMLSLPILAMAGPEMAILGVHPVSLILPVTYVLGVRASARARQQPMWKPTITAETREDRPSAENDREGPLAPMVGRFVVHALVLAAAGWAISRTGGEFADRSGLSETAVGATLTAVSTSLPELVTTLAAVRRGAVQLAVGGIIGGNTFDVLFLTAADVAYRPGSLYHAVGLGELFWLGVGLAMVATLLIGLVVREKRGPAGMGFESLALLAIYALALTVQAVVG